MIEVLNHKKHAPVRPFVLKKVSVTTIISPVPETDKPEVTGNKKKEGEEEVIPFNKWTQPPQPEGYIQYLPFDPF